MYRAALVRIQGVVQAVGFRPFVYRVAVKHGLRGYVTNLEDATVEVLVEGDEDSIKAFLRDLRREAPPVAEIRKVDVYWDSPKGYKTFEIKPSQFRRVSFGSIIPPDIAICDECISDMFTPGSRWYHYPFTCCAHCGPRFTAVWSLPYDRSRTNMRDFPLCRDCRREYEDPMDRRFHAQGICCRNCGPQMELLTGDGEPVPAEDPVMEAAKLLAEGWILAVKGIGGFHLAVRVVEDEPVLRLRERKRRPHQPLALMSPSVDAIKTFAVVSEAEEALLRSWRRPIVVLRKSPDYYLSEWVSPHLDTVGVMLPYTGIHLLLLHYCGEPAVVMTSGNPRGLPMAITNEEALRTLNGIADYFLLHNRDIANRCDDSVVRLVDGTPVFYRRSRGYVPTPIQVPVGMGDEDLVVALGSELRNVGAILHRSRCFLTQYIGDTDNVETLDYLKTALWGLKRLLGIQTAPTAVACDLNPVYLTTRLAGELASEHGCRLIQVQHHHAHAASLMAEGGVPQDQQILAIVMDGVGYGPDGSAWGGELLKAGYTSFQRLGHLERHPMPGGDLCALYPDRMLISILGSHLKGDVEELRRLVGGNIPHLPHGEREFQLITARLKNPGLYTSSAGRFLDAVAALTDVCHRRTYEGEPAIRLEAAATHGDPDAVPVSLEFRRDGGRLVLETGALLYELALALRDGARRVDVCAAAQRALADGVARAAVELAREYGLDVIGVSGGVFMNAYILRAVRSRVEGEGLRFLCHRLAPPGDGGVALGQAAVAAAHLRV